MSKGNDSREFFEVLKSSEGGQNITNKDVKPDQEPPEAPSSQKHPVPEVGDKVHSNRPVVSADPLDWIKNTRKDDSVIRKKIDTTAPNPLSAAPSSKGKRASRKDEITLRQETLIIGAIAATFFSVACFFVGHKIGYNKGVLSKVEEWAETFESNDVKSGIGQPRSGEIPQKARNIIASQKAEREVGLPEAAEVQQGISSKVVSQRTEDQNEQPVIKDKWTLRVISYRNTEENIERAKEIAKMIQDTVGHNAFIVDAGKNIFICVGEFDTKESDYLANTQKMLAELKYENKKPFQGCYPIRIR
ncbi:MAG: hypothetical protein E3K32_07775 [wastewater metagenome]|nr:hypothetical protein [Candidatus Loosdrechtia aerotolerans]